MRYQLHDWVKGQIKIEPSFISDIEVSLTQDGAHVGGRSPHLQK